MNNTPPLKTCPGICCCWRNGWMARLQVFRADSPPWCIGLASPRLPPATIGLCSSLNCGRQSQGDRGFWWWRIHQIWGDDGKVMIVHTAHLQSKLWFSNDECDDYFNLKICLVGVWISPRTMEHVGEGWKSSIETTKPCCPICRGSAAAMFVRWKLL